MSTATTGNPPRAQAAQTGLKGQTGQTPQQPRRPRPAQGSGRPRGRRGTSTPGTLRLLLITLVALCLAWGALAALTVSQHASAAGDVAATSEALSLDAQQLYRSLADADVTTDTAYLNGSQEPAAAQRRYQADIARATAALKALTAASGNAGDSASLATLAASLPVYTGYVSDGQIYNSVGYLAGSSYVEVASEEMHADLLPAARSVFAYENSQLTSSSAQATGLPLMVVAIVAALVVGFVLFRAQRWLSGRTHRLVNPGLLLASAVGVIALLWLVIAFAVARADLLHAEAQGSTPAETLAQAEITAQQGRGDESLNLVARTGDTVFQQDFHANQARLGTLLSEAASTSAPSGARWATAAQSDANAWFAVNKQVHALDAGYHYIPETQLVIGPGPGTVATDFGRLDTDIGNAIAADQAVFSSSAAAGSGAFGGLEAGVIVAALVMAACCAWGLSRRLAEYR
jgi:hypothetical protein